MPKQELFSRTERALRDFFYREKIADLIVRCCWRTGLVFAEEMPGGLVVELELAGHDSVERQRGAFPQAEFVKLRAPALETDVPGGSRVAVKSHRLAIDHAVLLTPAAV